MNIFEAIVFLVLRRIPFVRDLSFVRSLGTVDGAINSLTKAARRLEKVAEREINAAAGKRTNASALVVQAIQHEKSAARAQRVSGKLDELTA